jgi:hypothetical protein
MMDMVDQGRDFWINKNKKNLMRINSERERLGIKEAGFEE